MIMEDRMTRWLREPAEGHEIAQTVSESSQAVPELCPNCWELKGDRGLSIEVLG